MEKNVIQINGGITINFDVSIKRHICKKYYIWNPAPCSCENEKYLASIMDESEITCDEIIDVNAEANSNNEVKSYEKKTKIIPNNKICETKSFHISLGFLLITMALLIAVIIYCYLIKYTAKQKHLLSFNTTNNELII